MKVTELHRKALEEADRAEVFNFKGQVAQATKHYLSAMRFEKSAADLARIEHIGEPTISVLYRSAASLAFNGKNYKEAEKLVAAGLAGDPPDEIANELRDLFEEVNFHRHLDLNGIQLTTNELQVVFVGNGVCKGMVKAESVIHRIDSLDRIGYRSAERKAGRPFRSSGKVSGEMKDSFQPFLSEFRRASFAFTLRIGGIAKQLEVFNENNSITLIDDIVENMRLVNEANFDELKTSIPEESYYLNFVNLVKELAPDGDDIKMVGFTYLKDGKEQRLQFTRTRNDIDVPPFFVADGSKDAEINVIELEGVLAAADKDKKKLRLNISKGVRYFVNVPEGLKDVVKKYFEEEVRIKGTQIKPHELNLISIDPK